MDRLSSFAVICCFAMLLDAEVQFTQETLQKYLPQQKETPLFYKTENKPLESKESKETKRLETKVENKEISA